MSHFMRHMKISPQSDIIKNRTNQVSPNREKGNNTFKLVLILSVFFLLPLLYLKYGYFYVNCVNIGVK